MKPIYEAANTPSLGLLLTLSGFCGKRGFWTAGNRQWANGVDGRGGRGADRTYTTYKPYWSYRSHSCARPWLRRAKTLFRPRRTSGSSSL